MAEEVSCELLNEDSRQTACLYLGCTQTARVRVEMSELLVPAVRAAAASVRGDK